MYLYGVYGGSLVAQWARMRIYPPSGVLPNTTYGAVIPVSTSSTCTFTLSNSIVNFGSINPGTQDATSGTSWNSILITNTGTAASDISLSGTTWAYNSNSFDSGNTVWDWQSGTSWATANKIPSTTTSTSYSLSPSGTKNMFFGVGIPAATPGGAYQQTIDIISSC